MNNSFSLQWIQKTSNLDANLVSRHNKVNLTADFMRMNFGNPKLKQSQIANKLGYSTNTLQRYRNDIRMLSPFRINPNNTNKRIKKTSNTTFDKHSHREPNVKRPQMTSNDLKTTPTTEKSNKKHKNFAKSWICAREYWNQRTLFRKNSSE